MKIDIFRILLQNPEIRINMTNDFNSELRSLIFKNYQSFMNFSREEKIPRIENFHHTSLSSWLKEKREYRTAMPSRMLWKIVKRFNIDSEHVFANIENFQVWTGKKVNVPRWIEIDNGLAYGIGLYAGEGKNNDQRKCRMSITNTNMEIMKFASEWFEKYFNINRNFMRVYVNVYEHGDLNEIKTFLKKVSSVSKIPAENVLPIPNSNPRVPSVEIAYDSKILRFIIEFLRDNVGIFISKNRNLGVWYAKGIMDGEGHIRHSQPEIILEMYDTKALDIVELTYRKFKMTPNRSEDGRRLVIGARDFKRLGKIGAFWLHKEKLEKFNKNLDSIKNIQEGVDRSLFRVMKFLNSNNGFYTSKEISNKLGFSCPDYTRTLLIKAEILGHVKKIGGGCKHNPWKFKITKNGMIFVKEKTLTDSELLKRLEKNILSDVDLEVKKWVSA